MSDSPTTKSLLDTVIARARSSAQHATGQAGREFALAATHAEDAQMRYTRGLAFDSGTFAPADLEA